MKVVLRHLRMKPKGGTVWVVIWYEPDFAPHFQVKVFDGFDEAHKFADEMRKIP